MAALPQARRRAPLTAQVARPGGQGDRVLSRDGDLNEDIYDTTFSQTGRDEPVLHHFPGKVRVSIPGAKHAVTLQSRSSLRPNPRRREARYFWQWLNTHILASSGEFRAELAFSHPVTVQLLTFSPTCTFSSMVAQRASNDFLAASAESSSAQSFTLPRLEHTSLEGMSRQAPADVSHQTFPYHQMATIATSQPTPPAPSAPPSHTPFHPPGPLQPQRTPLHLRNVLSSEAMTSAVSLPQGGPGPVGRSRRDQNNGVRDLGWRERHNVKLRFSGFPRNAGTLEVWSAFSMKGHIDLIELNADHQGVLDGSGVIRFKPPPVTDFWNHGFYKVRSLNNLVSFSIRLLYLGADEKPLYSGIRNEAAKYPELMEVRAESLEFGVLTAPMEMRAMHRTVTRPGVTTSLVQDLRNRRIEIYFPVQIGLETPQFKLQISHTQPMSVIEVTHPDSPEVTALIFTIETPPLVWRKCAEAQSHAPGEYRWFANDAWWRQTEISYDPLSSRPMPTSLQRRAPGVNVGRWKTYRILFDFKKNGRAEYSRLVSALRDFNIRVRPCPNFLVTGREVTPVWKYIDRQDVPLAQDTASSLAQLMDDIIPLAFEVRYQLEVCISEGLLNEHSMPRMFIEELHKLEKHVAMELLEGVASDKKQYFDPMAIFQCAHPRAIRQKIPNFCVYMRSVVVTPTTVYFASPMLEISNRVVRQYRDLADRFLRVRFQDELPEGKIHSSQRDQSHELFTRVKRTMANGITIGDRHYEFLAFGNSQFREHGAFFFASTQYLSAAKIRRWMGDFDSIRNVAKYAARLGQCFSTTRAINTVRPSIVECVDIKTDDGKHMFTDGVGRVSPFLAFMAAQETGALVFEQSPSLMQFRLGGCKGVLAIWPQAKQFEIHMRQSQFKFSAAYEGLEIIRWSQFSAAHLNRQLITVLSARGVSDEVFIKKLDDKVADVTQAMVDHRIAERELRKELDPSRTNLVLAEMVKSGLHESNEPFLMSMLQLWRAFTIKYLKEKAKIPIQQGAVLLGCVDESGKLKGYFKDRQPHPTMGNHQDALPEIFVQVTTADGGRREVKTGIIAVARNPSLYAGDIQVVRGVDIPELRSLVDVVVFPNHGDRDVPSMLSGGDLDGDDFVVIWDPELVPTMWHEAPADFTPGKPQEVDHEPTVDEITSFFVQYMKNDSLGLIGTAHLAMADLSPSGVRDPRCIALAELHSKAVDYNKTGEKAVMLPKQKPPRYPHFMPRKHGRTYTSNTALGKLYDRVDLVDFAPNYAAPFHQGILNAYPVDDEMLAAAKELKGRYDQAMRRIMMQHDIKTDFEVWSTFVMQHANFSNDFKFHEKIVETVDAVKKTFLAECRAKAGGDGDFEMLERFAVAMYKATQQEVEEALERRRREPMDEGLRHPTRANATHNMPFMSFPWLLADKLCRIAAANPVWPEPRTAETPRGLRPKHEAGAAQLPKPKAKTSTTPVLKAAKSEVVELLIPESKEPTPKGGSKEEDVLFTRHGTVHFGDMLTLFDNDGKNGADSSGTVNAPTSTSEESAAPKAPEPGVGDLVAALDDTTVEREEGTISPYFNGPLAASPFADRKQQSPAIGAHLQSSFGLRNEPMGEPEPPASIESLLGAAKTEGSNGEQSAGGSRAETDEIGFEGDDEDEIGEEVEVVLPAVQKPNPFDKLASLNAE